MPYLWKVFSAGGNFAFLGVKWCPTYLHNGGDERNHERYIDEFGPNARKIDGLDGYCIACTRRKHNAHNEEQRALKKLKPS